MKNNRIKSPVRRVLVILAFYLAIILMAMILGVTHQIAGWVAQTAIATALLRLTFLFGWGAAKNVWRWRA